VTLDWSYVLAAIGIFGLWLVGRRSAAGWVVGILAQVPWFVFALATDQHGFILTAIAYATVNGWNLWKWMQTPKELRGLNPVEREKALIARDRALQSILRAADTWDDAAQNAPIGAPAGDPRADQVRRIVVHFLKAA